MFGRKFLIALTLWFCVGQVSAAALGEHEEECYSIAMVGYDSVINSNLGVPLDEVISTMVTNNDSIQTIDIYQDYLMFVVMDAYNWRGTPHTYAVKTLYKCAVEHAEGQIVHN